MEETQETPAEAVDEPPNALTVKTIEVSEFLESKAEQLGRVLHKKVDPDQFLQVCKAAVLRNPDLLKCVPMTLYGAMFDAASLGLSVDPRAREFWLIPRKNKHLKGQHECTGMIGYQGFITLAKRAGVALKVTSRVVYQDEVDRGLVEIDLAPDRVRHQFSFTEIDRSDNAIVAAYALAELPNGAQIVEPLTREQIDARARRTTFWRDWFPEMARKTAVRALFGRGNFPLTDHCAEPHDKSMERPTLGHAMEIHDKGEQALDEDAQPVAIDAPEADPIAVAVEGAEPTPVAPGEVAEEEA